MASYRISTAGVDEGAARRERAAAAGGEVASSGSSSAAGSGYRSSWDSGVFFYSEPQLSSTAPVTRDNKQRASILSAELAVPASRNARLVPPLPCASSRSDASTNQLPSSLKHTVPPSSSSSGTGSGSSSSGGDILHVIDTTDRRPHNNTNHTQGLLLDNLPESGVDPHPPPDRPRTTPPPPPPRRTKHNRSSSSSSSASSSSSSGRSRSGSSTSSGRSRSSSPREVARFSREMDVDEHGAPAAQAPVTGLDLSAASGEVVIVQDTQSTGRGRYFTVGIFCCRPSCQKREVPSVKLGRRPFSNSFVL